MTMTALETWHLSKVIKGCPVLDDISLEVPRGGVFALLGPEGSGKGAFLKIILGVEAPTSGGGLCLGLDILTRGVQIREKVGFTGQATRYYGYMPVARLLKFCRGFYPQWDEALAAKILKQFDLPLSAKIRELPPEAQQGLGLALALAPRPDLLLLDRPTEGFDPVRRRLYYDLAREEMNSRGGTIVISSATLDEVSNVADQAALLHRGRLLYAGPMAGLRPAAREIRVVFQKEPQDLPFHHPGISRVRREKNAYIVTVTENLEEIWQKIAALPHYALELDDSGLEGLISRFAKEERKSGTVLPLR